MSVVETHLCVSRAGNFAMKRSSWSSLAGGRHFPGGVDKGGLAACELSEEVWQASRPLRFAGGAAEGFNWPVY